MNSILDRQFVYNQIVNHLKFFEQNKQTLSIQRAIFIYGECGGGKSYFVKELLKQNDYDTIIYDTSFIRNKQFIENMTKLKSTNVNVLSMFQEKQKKIAIIMEDIDSMCSGDKSGINSLIKLLRPKKTKKQKKEDISYIPIICIGNALTDKKIIELGNVCHTFCFKLPTTIQMRNMVQKLFINIDLSLITSLVGNNLHKLFMLYNIYNSTPELLYSHYIRDSFNEILYNDNIKNTARHLLRHPIPMNNHQKYIHETDRTTIALILHENIIDYIEPTNNIALYKELLQHFCFADYIDRNTFQKQIWQLNEMSSTIKIMYNLFILHNSPHKINAPHESRFTKILTKYSTEYNNSIFIKDLCQKLDMDKKDMFLYFLHMQQQHYTVEQLEELLINNNITTLEIQRIYRLLT